MGNIRETNTTSHSVILMWFLSKFIPYLLLRSYATHSSSCQSVDTKLILNADNPLSTPLTLFSQVFMQLNNMLSLQTLWMPVGKGKGAVALPKKLGSW